MRLLILLTADHAYTDNITGKLYVLGAFNFIGAAQFPARHEKLALVIRLTSEFADPTTEQILTTVLTDQDGQEILRYEQPFSLPIQPDGSRPYFNLIIEFGNILFPQAGSYEFRVSVGDEMLGTTLIDIVDMGQ